MVIEGLLPVTCPDDRPAIALKQGDDGIQHRWMIFDDENRAAAGRHRATIIRARTSAVKTSQICCPMVSERYARWNVAAGPRAQLSSGVSVFLGSFPKAPGTSWDEGAERSAYFEPSCFCARERQEPLPRTRPTGQAGSQTALNR